MVRAFISYSHDSTEHNDRVWDLCERLRKDGIDCRIDQHEFSPSEGWPRWCKNQIQESQFILVVCTETYNVRYEGKGETGMGLGVKWEGFVISQELYEAEGSNAKFIPIVFSIQDTRHIPTELRAATRYVLDNQADYENLLRHLTNQPAQVKSGIAPEIRSLPPHPRRQTFSGSLWNVPLHRNLFFTGREDELKEVERGLKSSGIVAIKGIGGTGKTETAVEYAYRHRDEYSAVLWASALSRDTLISEFCAIAKVLNLPLKDEADQNLVVDAVKCWLVANEDWLLILDNSDGLAIVPDFVPSANRGHVLITTQAQATGGVQGISITDMLPHYSALLLLRRAKIIKADDELDAASESDSAAAAHIARELGGLPLALDQVGAYIEETGCGFEGYLELYRQRHTDLLKRRGESGPNHPESVATTFALSFARIKNASKAAADLLCLCAFLHPDAIPEEILTMGTLELGTFLGPVTGDPLKLDEAFAEMLKYSLLRRDPGAKTFSVHQLVQIVLRNGMEVDSQRQWAERAVKAVNAVFPSVEFSNWTQCERLLTQALACAALIDNWAINITESARLLGQAGYYLHMRGHYADAEPLLQRALAIWQRCLGSEHPNVAASLNNLACLYRDQGRHSGAESYCRRALEMREKLLGVENPDVAASLNNLGSLYQDQGRYIEAEPLYRRALDIRGKVLGLEHPDFVVSLNNLARLYHDQGKYAEAGPLLDRTLETRQKLLGLEHPDVANSLNNLAGFYQTQGKYNQAEPLFKQAMTIWERALGPEHPMVAKSLDNLGRLRFDQGKYIEAELLYERALKIKEKALGPEHPSLGTCLTNLALLYKTLGKADEAETLYERALKISTVSLRVEHPLVATNLNNLAGLYRDQGKYREAEPVYKRALAIRERVLGPEHPDVANILNNLAELYQAQGRYGEAEPLYQRALRIYENALGPDHPNVAIFLENYAILLREKKRIRAAKELEARAKAIRDAHSMRNPNKK